MIEPDEHREDWEDGVREAYRLPLAGEEAARQRVLDRLRCEPASRISRRGGWWFDTGVVRVSQGVMAGLLVSKVAPDYPADAKQARIQGTVVMRVIVDKEGNVANIQLISGHPLLVAAAKDAVQQYVYKPTLLNGSPVEVITQVDVNFSLGN